MDKTEKTFPEQRPYEPSIVDRLNDWVERLPLPALIFQILLGLALIFFQVICLGLEGGLYAKELLPVIIFNGAAVPFLLARIHLLNREAVAAVNSMRPMLEMNQAEFDDYRYRLSTMPFWGPLIAGTILTASVILTPLVSNPPARYAALVDLPVFSVVYHIIDKLSAFLFGVILYHTFRQLRLINSINSRHLRINLFHLRTLNAFSRLTASTALGLLFFIYLWMLINPELLADPVLIAYSVLLTSLAVIIFVWPLWGIHKLMEDKKVQALHDIDLRFETLFKELNRSIDEDNHEETDRLNRTIASLDVQYTRISDVPTWPWRAETARLVLTAIAIPLVLMVLQYFVLQALNR